MKRCVFCILLGAFSSIPLFAESWMGAGNPEDPYQITSINHLMELSERVLMGFSYEGYYFRLNADLNMSDTEDEWTPIGSFSTPFAGYFDGNGKEIKGLSFKGGDYVGLFGYLAHTAVVKNLTFIEPEGWSRYCTGVICGLNEGLIQSCTVGRGEISNVKIIGGIAGINYGVIDSCYNYCYMYSRVAIGGISGFNYGTITNCVNFRDFEGLVGIGGIVGLNGGFSHVPCNHESHELGVVSHCVNNGMVIGDTYAGGICGRNQGTVRNCKNSGSVRAIYAAGGIVGVNGSIVNAPGYIYNSYCNATIFAEDSVAGGICGTNTANGFIDNVFSQGETESLEAIPNLIVDRDEGFSDHLYYLLEDVDGYRYYDSLNTIVSMLNHWADTTFVPSIYSWLLWDSDLSFVDNSTPTEVDKVQSTHQAEIVVGGIWLAEGASVYTIRGELVYMNNSAKRCFIPLRDGLYLSNGTKVLVVHKHK